MIQLRRFIGREVNDGILVFPLIMIVFGWIFKEKSPKEINSFYGYRTSMSMKNKDTWEFAHHYVGRLWWFLGWILVLLTVITMLCTAGMDSDTVGKISLVVVVVQMIFLIGSIFPTERALKRTFDRDGNRR